jgi:ATP-dependent protease ClpP protease subunit
MKAKFSKLCLTYFLVIICVLWSYGFGDTFSKITGTEVYHGYAKSKNVSGKNLVETVEKGPLYLNLAEYDIEYNATGRNEFVSLMRIPDQIHLEMETAAFEKAIKYEADRGPLFILIEIDSPGGRVDLAIRMCNELTSLNYCKTVAYIGGGRYGGAFSAGAALALACDMIYMADNTVIGAATMITVSKEGKPEDVKDAIGEDVGEKMGSAWRNYLASLAQRNGRSAMLAKAMEDKEIEVVEVRRDGKSRFIDPINKRAGQKVFKTWSKKGSLLTLTAPDAVKCGMADALAASKAHVLMDLNAADAKLIMNHQMSEARQKYDLIMGRLKTLDARMDLGLRRLNNTTSRRQALKSMRKLIRDTKYMLRMKQEFGEDIPADEANLQMFLNAVKAEYENLKSYRY